jgi:hypothetical protein
LTFSQLELSYIGLFQNICNFTKLSFYHAHHDPFTHWKFYVSLINLRRSFINSLSHCQHHSVLLVERTKQHFVSKNAPHYLIVRNFLSIFFHYPKKSNPLLSTILPHCMGHCF